MTRASFVKLLNTIWPFLALDRNKGATAVNDVVPYRLMLAATLRVLAGGLVLDVSSDHEMGWLASARTCERARERARLI